MNPHRSLRTALRTLACAASTMVGGLLTLGCGCATYDGDGNHMDGSGDSGDSSGSGGSGGDTGSGGSGGDTGTPDACTCLAAYMPSASMDAAAIRKLSDEGLATCFGSDPVALEQQSACLPMIVGQDAANGKNLQVYYACSDVCPDAGSVGLAYEGITDQGACCAIGGIPVISAGFGAFEACAPAALGNGEPTACAD